MALRYFGTDGVRGKAGLDLTEDFARSLGRAAGLFLSSSRNDLNPGARPVVSLGHDTRLSSPGLARACAEGLASAGVDVVYLGIVPTATVAFAVTRYAMAGGCVVSASHNPPEDNGIKFFGPGGYKLAEQEEARIEELLDQDDPMPSSAVSSRGSVIENMASEIVEAYLEHLASAVDYVDLEGFRVVLDCANGAASVIGPASLERLGAEVAPVRADGDGSSINVGCGATNPEFVASETKRRGYPLGLAVDGDADRLIAVDDQGAIYGGDHLMAAFAAWMLEDGKLDPRVVVATVMSNLGLKIALAERGIELVECSVGDRNVVETMRRVGAKLGGEQSGHLVFADFATTGDGILTAAMLAAMLRRKKISLAEATKSLRTFPQVLVNVRVRDKAAAAASPSLARSVARARQRLGSSGRVLVRPSGTEPLVRIMVEAPEKEMAESLADEIAAVVRREYSEGL